MGTIVGGPVEERGQKEDRGFLRGSGIPIPHSGFPEDKVREIQEEVGSGLDSQAEDPR